MPNQAISLASSWAFVFGAVFLLDLFWAKYTIAIEQRRALTAGFHSTIIYVLGGAAVIQYVGDPWLLIPAVLGAFSGTYWAVRAQK